MFPRTPSFILVLFLLFTILTVPMLPDSVGQSTSVESAKQHIITATVSIRQAEQQGVSNSDLLPLTEQLNTALQYEETANTLMSQGNYTTADAYAHESITLSSQVESQAEQLGTAAQATIRLRNILTYIIAIVLALISTIVILGIFRIHRTFQERKLSSSRIDYN